MPDPRAMSIAAHLMELAALVPPIDEDEEGPFARGDDGLERRDRRDTARDDQAPLDGVHCERVEASVGGVGVGDEPVSTPVGPWYFADFPRHVQDRLYELLYCHIRQDVASRTGLGPVRDTRHTTKVGRACTARLFFRAKY